MLTLEQSTVPFSGRIGAYGFVAPIPRDNVEAALSRNVFANQLSLEPFIVLCHVVSPGLDLSNIWGRFKVSIRLTYMPIIAVVDHDHALIMQMGNREIRHMSWLR